MLRALSVVAYFGLPPSLLNMALTAAGSMLDGFALFGICGKVKPELRHGDPVALRFERVRFLRKPEAVTGVISELV
jgi:hypothetical protein